MAELASSGVTRLLLAWRDGDAAALEQLTPIVYEQLRRLAHRHMRRERVGHVLQTTALVHEAYLRLVGLDVEWQGRNHFFALASRMMRRVLVDFARRRQTDKRGGELVETTLEVDQLAVHRSEDLIALDDALRSLEALDPRKGQVVELRYFGGLTIPETAAALGISHATVERDLKLARAWLVEQMGAGVAAS